MPRLLADLAPARRHPAFRRLWMGQLASQLGSQLTMVGVSYQTYRLGHSTLLVGMVSLAQLVPLLLGALVGGPIVDAFDRRRILVITPGLFGAASAGLLLNALSARPALWPLFGCTAISAALQGLDFPARRSSLRQVVPRTDLAAALALQSIASQAATVLGPTAAGLLIGWIGFPAIYAVDMACRAGSLVTSLGLPRLPSGARAAGAAGADAPDAAAAAGQPGLESLVEGLRYFRWNPHVASVFWIDLNAMVFGMPRAAFPALATHLYGGGASTVGLLYAAPGAGALAGALLTGWVSGIRRQGRAVVICVLVWGAAIAAFGLVPVMWLGLCLLVVAGAADVISAVFRMTIVQLTTPDGLQGRVNGLLFAGIQGGPRLGDAETGGASALGGPQLAVWSGGLACIAGAVLMTWRFPQLWRFDRDHQGKEWK